jgi:hypothetical protein
VISLRFIREAVKLVPQVIPLLMGKARAFYFGSVAFDAFKSYEDMLSKIQSLVKNTYNGKVGTVEFTDRITSIIGGQLRNAYNTAWINEGMDEDNTSAALPDYLEESLLDMIETQTDSSYSYQYYTDIMKARSDKAPIDTLLSRAELWAGQWNTAYENATSLITLNNGGREEWVLGATEQHCPECAALNGIVAFANEWEELGVRPKNPPNDNLTCGGWRCDCERRATDKKRSRNAYNRIVAIVK